FLHGVGEGLFAIDMQPAAESADGGGSMMMVGSRDDNGVEIFLLKQLAVIGVALRRFAPRRRATQPPFVDVAEGHDVLLFHGVQIACPATADTDNSNIQSFVRPEHSRGRNERQANTGSGGERERRLKKRAA